MKMLAIIALVALLVAPGMAMTDNQTAYLKGFQDGWNLLLLRLTDIPAYNEEVAKYNTSLAENLNASEAAPLLIQLCQFGAAAGAPDYPFCPLDPDHKSPRYGIRGGERLGDS